jgi:hypothetical protein
VLMGWCEFLSNLIESNKEPRARLTIIDSISFSKWYHSLFKMDLIALPMP